MTEINKEIIVTYMKEEASKPLSIKEVEEIFEVKGSTEYKQLVKTMNELEEEGALVRTRRDLYGVPEKMNLRRGEVIMHQKGFAFVKSDGEEDDVYIASSDINGAMNKDQVLVRLRANSNGARPEGEIIRIIERGTVQIVGSYSDNKHYGFVIPDNKRIPNDIFIPKGKEGGAVDGHKVLVHITKYPEGRMSAEGQVIHILGHKNDPGVDILSIIYKHGLPGEFNQETLEHAQSIPGEVQENELANRRDLRDEVIVTIDGEDAKDLDDAVMVKKLENGNYKLGVHISDIAHYVREGSPIDKEAAERATSVYLVDRVIPMIPHRLSNGICSLNPQVDRLTLSCEMEFTPGGKLVNHEIFESVIKTTERMTYNDVRKILEDEDQETIERYESLVPMFKLMEELQGILRKKRMDRGAIDFDFKEAQVLVNEEGVPTDIVARDRSIAEKIIEEFMLAANETVAERFHWLKVPFVYRIHEDPDEGKLEQFFEFITNFGYVVKGTAGTIHPRALQELLLEVKGEPEEAVISTVMLRSMKQAKYEPENKGHFGLSSDFYTHFTAPIRRYPDLIVHRLIRTYLIEGKTNEETFKKWNELLPDITRHSSEMERRAEDASRETDELKKIEYMVDKVGEEFEGVISGVTNFGIFVELANTVEGLVHVSFLTDDYYHYNESQYAMIGERTGNVYQIGDLIEVRVANVSVEERIIDFEVVGMKAPRKARSKSVPRVIEGGNRKKEGKSKSTIEKKGLNLGANPDNKKKGNRKKRRNKPFYENAPSTKKNKGKKK